MYIEVKASLLNKKGTCFIFCSQHFEKRRFIVFSIIDAVLLNIKV